MIKSDERLPSERSAGVLMVILAYCLLVSLITSMAWLARGQATLTNGDSRGHSGRVVSSKRPVMGY